MLDFRRLRVLHTVGRLGSVTAAARALSLTAPAVSQNIAALERETGVNLTERVGRGIRLTPAAMVLVHHTDAMLAQLRAAEGDLASMSRIVHGNVRLAAFASAVKSVVSPALRAMAHAAPGVAIDVLEAEPTATLPALERGTLDVAVAHEYDMVPWPVRPGLERWELLRDPLVAATPQSRRAAGDLRLADLSGDPWVMPGEGTECYELVRRACAAEGFVPAAVAHCRDFDAVASLVGAGAGVALVPLLAITPRSDVALSPLSRRVSRSVFAVARSGGDRHPAVRVVLEALLSAAQGEAARLNAWMNDLADGTQVDGSGAAS